MSTQGTVEQWLTWAFSPTISAILVTILIGTLLPILTHWYLYRSATSKELPLFLLLGPSGAGKTSLLTLLANGTASETHTSQSPSTTTITLPSHLRTSADKYRSENDPTTSSTTTANAPRFTIYDTPGHGKLRHHAFTSLSDPTLTPSKSTTPSTTTTSTKISSLPFPTALIFTLDSAALSNPTTLTETATYLHDTLLHLQRRATALRAKNAHAEPRVPVLVAANKQDVFSALPPGLIAKKLAEEVGKVRVSRSRGIVEARVEGKGGEGGDGVEGEEEDAWLGEFGTQKFEFAQMEECGVEVKVVGGSVRGEDGGEGRVEDWWEWIAENL